MVMKYFPDNIDYPNVLGGEILPDGTLWSYVSSTFLNGFINYIQPVKCYLMNRYRDWDEVREDGDLKSGRSFRLYQWGIHLVFLIRKDTRC